MAGERSLQAAGFDVGEAFGQLGVNDAALFGGIFVVRAWEFRKDRDYATRRSELEFLATPKTPPPTNGRRNHEGYFIVVFDGDGHDGYYMLER